jgi:hypothetical protein
MIATYREKYSSCSQLDPPTPQKKITFDIKALIVCSQPTYLTNLRKKTLHLKAQTIETKKKIKWRKGK